MSALAAGISSADGCLGGGNGANKEGEAERAEGVPQHLQHRLCLQERLLPTASSVVVVIDGSSDERPRPLPRASGHMPLSSTAPAPAPSPFPSTVPAWPPFPPIQRRPRPSPRLRWRRSRLGPRRWSRAKEWGLPRSRR